MKKLINILVSAVLLLSGCSSPSSAVSSVTEEPAVDESTYTTYEKSMQDAKTKDTWTVSVRSQYDLRFTDSSVIRYALDGVLENDGTSMHMKQNINSNGMFSRMEGYYYDGRFYNTYNGISYYEDMKETDVKAAMLVPLEPAMYGQNQLLSLQAEDTADGNRVYTLTLTPEASAAVFTERYDTYNLKQYDDFAVTSAVITDVFDKEGHFTKEEAVFRAEVTYSGQKITVDYSADTAYINIGTTEVAMTDDLRNEHNAFVSFAEIDPDSIEVEEIPDDTEGSTVTETFRKRLISRLGYEKKDNGTYSAEFNANEAYTINFDTCTFEYSSYSIVYSYSWKNEVGSMGACTYKFLDGAKSSSCEDSTIEMIQQVKSYLEMELYYCGLSLESLQKEAE